MSHAYNSIWIHAIWASKERKPLIYPSIEQKLYQFISDQFRELGCPVRIINGMPDHIHCLFLLNAQKSVSETIKHVKGGSSYYINSNNLISEKFYWQTGYSAFSVSASVVEDIFHYIQNQKEHHQRRPTKRAVGRKF
jgi:REP element-mobilizing transposase RayT